MIVGTVAYMSPEQARGKPADYRSDQFSFGLLLYEMTTAKKAFARDESVQTMAAIISEEAPPIEGKLPAPLRWVIERCLAKEAAGRYESSRDLARELRSIRSSVRGLNRRVERDGAAGCASSRATTMAAAFVRGAATVLTVVAFRAARLCRISPAVDSHRFHSSRVVSDLD